MSAAVKSAKHETIVAITTKAEASRVFIAVAFFACKKT